MKQYTWILALFVLISLCRLSESRTLTKRQIHLGASIEPGHGEYHPEVWRDKKKVEAKWGIKNALLGFVFNPSSRSSSSFSSSKTVTSTTKRPTTTEDIVIYEKYEPVTAAVPSELFNTGFTLVSNVSKRIGDFMLDSASRAHRLLESMRPFLWKVFGKKGIVIEATTDKPIFTDPKDVSTTTTTESNSI